jgi:hypothetical protein
LALHEHFDVVEGIIRYFTTEPEFRQELPVTIAKWVEGLDGYNVEYMTKVNSIPNVCP